MIANKYISTKLPLVSTSERSAMRNLRMNADIVISKPDKGSGVVIMDRHEYVEKMLSILHDTTKFQRVSSERSVKRGRKPLVFHPLLEKESELDRFLVELDGKIPKDVSKSIRPRGSRLAHMYGLPKMHKPGVPLRPVLSATGTYNFELAKWLNSVLQPLVNSQHSVDSAFEFVDLLKDLPVASTMVSFDVVSLFTNVPLHDTIDVILDRVFTDGESSEYLTDMGIDVSRAELRKLLELATSRMLFTFDGQLYEQIDGVSMGSPLGPLFANFFLGHLESNVFERREQYYPVFYVRYVDDTFLLFSVPGDVDMFLKLLNEFHPSIQFTCEFSVNETIPFIGVNVKMTRAGFETSVYHKRCDKGIFLHSQSFCDEKYKNNLMKMLCHRAFTLSSNWAGFHEEIERSTKCLRKLGYDPEKLSDDIRCFLQRKLSLDDNSARKTDVLDSPLLVLPFRGVRATRSLKYALEGLCRRTSVRCPKVVFTSVKLSMKLRRPEKKPNLVNSGGVTYLFKCPVTGCKSCYVGVTRRHLFQRVREHVGNQSGVNSAVYDHLMMHDIWPSFDDHLGCFEILVKTSSFRHLLFAEAFHIKHLKCDLNKQSDSIVLNVF